MLVSVHVYATSDDLHGRSAYVLLTQDDQHILSLKDLDVEGKPRSFSGQGSLGDLYWQCFPTQNIKIVLYDMGYSSFGDKEDDGYLKLVVQQDSIVHQYIMRRHWSITDGKARRQAWKKLMKNESSACILGRFGHQTELKNHLKKYTWVFEALKTKQGEASYFYHPPHAV